MLKLQIWKKWLWAMLPMGALFVTTANAWGHPPHAHHEAKDESPAAPVRSRQSATIAALDAFTSHPPHGGQVSATGLYLVEVVYLTHETRVYVFASDGTPLSTSRIRGGLQMEVRGNPRHYRYALQSVRSSEPSATQDFLVAPIDVSQIRDGDMRVTLALDSLPFRQQPRTGVVQVFALSHPRMDVTVVEFTSADHDAAAQQGTCPVMKTPFDHGQPIKLMVGDHPLFVCCADCVQAVADEPERFRQPAATTSQKSAEPPSARAIVVAKATSADAREVRMQGECPVMGQPLGGHGTPLKVAVGDDVLFVCCKGCLRKVEADPDQYLAKAAASRNGQ